MTIDKDDLKGTALRRKRVEHMRLEAEQLGLIWTQWEKKEVDEAYFRSELAWAESVAKKYRQHWSREEAFVQLEGTIRGARHVLDKAERQARRRA